MCDATQIPKGPYTIHFITEQYNNGDHVNITCNEGYCDMNDKTHQSIIRCAYSDEAGSTNWVPKILCESRSTIFVNIKYLVYQVISYLLLNPLIDLFSA